MKKIKFKYSKDNDFDLFLDRFTFEPTFTTNLIIESVLKNLSKNSICSEIGNFFKKKISELSKNGISKEKIILDPGFGYEKTPHENLEIISKFNYTKFENPCLIGISRKGFLKKLTKDTNLDQTSATTGIISLLNGAKIIRTHNVPLTATMIGEVFG